MPAQDQKNACTKLEGVLRSYFNISDKLISCQGDLKTTEFRENETMIHQGLGNRLLFSKEYPNPYILFELSDLTEAYEN